jgi:hypothetical protein
MANGNERRDDGITLRDLFAAAALMGLQAHHDYGQNGSEWIANEAWLLADAMLVTRDTVPSPTDVEGSP